MSINDPLTPAQLAKQLVRRAEERALEQEWALYEEQRDKHLKELRHQRWVQRVYHQEEIIHGSRATYMNHGCRCEACRRANAEWMKQYRHKKGLSKTYKIRNYTHGTWYAYTHGGCRCDACKQAGREKNREFRDKRKQEAYKNPMGEQEKRTQFPVIETREKETHEVKRPVQALEDRERIEDKG